MVEQSDALAQAHRVRLAARLVAARIEVKLALLGAGDLVPAPSNPSSQRPHLIRRRGPNQFLVTGTYTATTELTGRTLPMPKFASAAVVSSKFGLYVAVVVSLMMSACGDSVEDDSTSLLPEDVESTEQALVTCARGDIRIGYCGYAPASSQQIALTYCRMRDDASSTYSHSWVLCSGGLHCEDMGSWATCRY